MRDAESIRVASRSRDGSPSELADTNHVASVKVQMGKMLAKIFRRPAAPHDTNVGESRGQQTIFQDAGIMLGFVHFTQNAPAPPPEAVGEWIGRREHEHAAELQNTEDLAQGAFHVIWVEVLDDLKSKHRGERVIGERKISHRTLHEGGVFLPVLRLQAIRAVKTSYRALLEEIMN